MRPSNAALLVQHDDCRPRLNAVLPPGRVRVVSHNWIANSEATSLVAHLFQFFFGVRLRCMDAYNRQALSAVSFIPTFNCREGVAAVITTECPEFDKDYLSPQPVDGK